MYNFSAGISMEEFFTRRELSSRRECYPDFASRQDSRRDPGEEFFSWRDPGEYRFLGGILAEIRGGNFSREGSRRENGPPRRDPGGIPVSAGNLGGIPARSRYLFYKGRIGFSYSSHHSFLKNFKTNKVRFVSGGPDSGG